MYDLVSAFLFVEGSTAIYNFWSYEARIKWEFDQDNT